MSKTILIVEDNPELSRVLEYYLTAEKFQCCCLNDGDLVETWVKNNSPNLILLDVVLPGQDGLTLCRSIRKFSNVPIIMVTGRSEEEDKLSGLDNGADDYICKPFRPKEVVARVKAVLKRVDEGFGLDSVESNKSFSLDSKRNRLLIGDTEVILTSVQTNLLALLMSNVGIVLTRDDLMNSIYPDKRIVSHRTIDSHIRELRKHIGNVLEDQEVIFSIYGAGYKFEYPVIRG